MARSLTAPGSRGHTAPPTAAGAAHPAWPGQGILLPASLLLRSLESRWRFHFYIHSKFRLVPVALLTPRSNPSVGASDWSSQLPGMLRQWVLANFFGSGPCLSPGEPVSGEVPDSGWECRERLSSWKMESPRCLGGASETRDRSQDGAEWIKRVLKVTKF